MPRSAYIHVPFCARRCGYCNFTLVAGRDDLVGDYLRALQMELSGLETPREVDTLFLGGGTPTHLAAADLATLLDIVARWFPLAPHGEYSVEANPADVDEQRVAVLVKRGVTRLSIGAQSFDAAKLRLLERDHAPDDIIRAFELARDAFGSVSLDLIFAAPGETLDNWRADLAAALRLQPDHISSYGLTFEKGTTFWSRLSRGDMSRIDEQRERDMYLLAIEMITAAGLEHYEVSNFARSGHRCRHNEVYWLGGEYYAAGPGAARHIAGRRETNHRSVTTWIRRILAGDSAIAESEELPPDDAARELLVFALRRLEGVDRAWFLGRTGRSIDALVGPQLRQHVRHGMFIDDGQRIRLTRKGLLLSDSIWPDFLAHTSSRERGQSL